MAKPTLPRYVATGGLTGVISDADIQIDGFISGKRYRLTAGEAGCVCRWSASAAVASNGNFDFAIGANESIEVEAQFTSLSIKEMSTASAATAALFVSEIEEGN